MRSLRGKNEAISIQIQLLLRIVHLAPQISRNCRFSYVDFSNMTTLQKTNIFLRLKAKLIEFYMLLRQEQTKLGSCEILYSRAILYCETYLFNDQVFPLENNNTTMTAELQQKHLYSHKTPLPSEKQHANHHLISPFTDKSLIKNSNITGF